MNTKIECDRYAVCYVDAFKQNRKFVWIETYCYLLACFLSFFVALFLSWCLFHQSLNVSLESEWDERIILQKKKWYKRQIKNSKIIWSQTVFCLLLFHRIMIVMCLLASLNLTYICIPLVFYAESVYSYFDIWLPDWNFSFENWPSISV